MIRSAFLFLFICAFFVGILSLLVRPEKIPPNATRRSVAKMALDTSGLTGIEERNKQTMSRINVQVRKGMMVVSEQMKMVKERQDKINEYISEQNQLLDEQSENMRALQEKLTERNTSGVDLARVRETVAAFEDQRRILKENGQTMAALNDEIRARAAEMREKMEMAKLTQGNAGDMATQAEEAQQKVDDMMEKTRRMTEDVAQRAQNAHDMALTVRQKLMDASSRADNRGSGGVNPANNDSVRDFVAKQDEIEHKLADQKSRADMSRMENQRLMDDSRQRAQDMMRENESKIQDARLKTLDAQQQLKDKIADQSQRMRDSSMARP